MNDWIFSLCLLLIWCEQPCWFDVTPYTEDDELRRWAEHSIITTKILTKLPGIVNKPIRSELATEEKTFAHIRQRSRARDGQQSSAGHQTGHWGCRCQQGQSLGFLWDLSYEASDLVWEWAIKSHSTFSLLHEHNREEIQHRSYMSLSLVQFTSIAIF